MSYIRYYSQPTHVNDRDLHDLSDYDQQVDQEYNTEKLMGLAKELKDFLREQIGDISKLFMDKRNVRLENPRIILGRDSGKFCIVFNHSNDIYFFSRTKEMVEEYLGYKYEAHKIILRDRNDLNGVHVHGR